jgi:hypothetical protein
LKSNYRQDKGKVNSFFWHPSRNLRKRKKRVRQKFGLANQNLLNPEARLLRRGKR